VGLPSQNFVVVDTHMMRRPSVAEPLLAEYQRSRQRILLPWRQFYEMATSTFAACVAPYLAEPGVLAVARPSFSLATDEKRFRVKHGTIVDPNDTRNISLMVTSLRDREPAAEERIGEFLDAVRERALRILALEGDAKVVKALTAWWKDHQTRQERANDIRSGLLNGDRSAFRAELVEVLSLETLAKILIGIDVGYKPRTVERISQWPSISALKTIGLLALGLHWRVMHGVETQSQEQLVNDGSDTEFCVIALYGRGFHTEETKWRELHGDCRAVCEHLWPSP
jgi:hypothetical protein